MDQPQRIATARLRMTGRVRFADAERLSQQLSELLSERPVEIDLAGLEDTDAATLQVMISARMQAMIRGQHLTLRLPESGPVHALIERLALSPHLGADYAV